MLILIRKMHIFYYGGVLFEGLAGLSAIILSMASGYDIFNNLSITMNDFLKGILYTFPVVLFFYFIFKIPIIEIKKIESIIINFVDIFLNNCGVLHFALISIVAGISEELLFRGFLQGYIGQKLGFLSGIIIANIAFGLMHPVSILYSLITFIAGCYFSAVLYFTKNLFVPIVAHSLYDFIALCYIKFRLNR